MHPKRILPVLLIGFTAVLMVVLNYPYFMRAQDAGRGESRLPAQPVSANKGAAPILPVIAPVNSVVVPQENPKSQAGFGVEKVKDGNVFWLVSPSPIPLTNTRIRISGFGAQKDQRIRISNEKRKIVTTEPQKDPGNWDTGDLDLLPTDGVVQRLIVELLSKTDDEKPIDNRFAVMVVLPDQQNRPTLKQVTNQRFFNGYKDPSNGALTIYPSAIGQTFMGFLIVPASALDQLEVQLFVKVQGSLVAAPPPEILFNDVAQGAKELHIRLPKEFLASPSADEHLAMIRVNRGPGLSHSYASQGAAFKVQTFAPLNPVPITSVTNTSNVALGKGEKDVFLFNGTALIVKGTSPTAASDAGVMIFRNQAPIPDAVTSAFGAGGWAVPLDNLAQGEQTFSAALVQGENIGPKSSVTVIVRTARPRVLSVEPQNFGARPGGKSIYVRFSGGPMAPLKKSDDLQKKDDGTAEQKVTGGFVLKKVDGGTAPLIAKATLDESGTLITLDLAEVPPPGNYELIVPELVDVFGNPLIKVAPFALVQLVGGNLPLVAPGLSGNATGPYITYPEFTAPRKKPDGFNPGDHVETRVVRLYYFRDAHRVAQILNRDAKSYNRVAVDTRRRLAEQARTTADQQSLNRKVNERNAVQAAQDTRIAEHQLEAAQEFLRNATQRRDQSQIEVIGNQQIQDTVFSNPKATEDDKRRAQGGVAIAQARVAEANDDIAKARNRVLQAQAAVQTARDNEIQLRNVFQTSVDQEDKLRADQFRLETAALHEDPDTYAPGHPHSVDPVRQVSISVVGESEIHLRGPLSGINVIREMVNQIDAPAGQVRVAIHTVQVNGERQEKMEKVIGGVQDYIDHSRFLTQQSTLMLRKAVLKVAGRKAFEAGLTHPGYTQEARDERYLYSFFGKDFIDELKAQKSEFLSSGNKLLCLNSMDTTSLAAALTVLALAKNETRQEILREFREMLAVQLPAAEQSFFEAGGPRNFNCWHCGILGRKHCVPLLATNARFQSFLGFFDGEVLGDDTLTPLQREFIKLAQIVKSRLVTELEVKQRVMERALVEDRVGNYQKELIDNQEAEKQAKIAFAAAHESLRTQQLDLLKTAQQVNGKLASVSGKFSMANDLLEKLNKDVNTLEPHNPKGRARVDGIRAKVLNYHITDAKEAGIRLEEEKVTVTLHVEGKGTKKIFFITQGTTSNPQLKLDPASESDLDFVYSWLDDIYDKVGRINDSLGLVYYDPSHYEIYQQLEKLWKSNGRDDDVFRQTKVVNPGPLVLMVKLENKLIQHIVQRANYLQDQFNQVTYYMGQANPNLAKAYGEWAKLRDADRYMKRDEDRREIKELVGRLDEGFQKLFKAETARRLAMEKFERNRQPLDHKKLLDMLIDEIQDKYVELLEGTRAYTANIDDYIKRVATALDDDFNTQFYLPAFRQIRTISTSWDVTLGQIETTSILTNNRTYAKVDPQATMEFDLPRRNILITEAFQGAKGLLDTYGALTQDPTFLNLVRLAGGMPTSMPALGQNAGVPSIRSVLPGLSRVSDESILAQNGPGAKSFGTPLDALVPDPAIYKFETGTAYEIRPVIQPDGQSVAFHFNYMYTTNIREPVRADEKHLGRVKRHFIDTNVQLGNYELREISKYQVTLRASRTGKGVPLLQDVPGVGVLFRPLPSAESSLQQNIILGQSTIFPTLFDLMGLRWAPAVADLDPLALTNADFIVRQRKRFLYNHVFDFSSSKVDEALRIPDGERRGDLYRVQETIPAIHPNGYQGPGMGLKDSHLREGYDPKLFYPETRFSPGTSRDGHLNPGTDADMRLREKMMTPGYVPPGGNLVPVHPAPVLPLPKSMPPAINGLPQPNFTPPAPRPTDKRVLPNGASSMRSLTDYTVVRGVAPEAPSQNLQPWANLFGRR